MTKYDNELQILALFIFTPFHDLYLQFVIQNFFIPNYTLLTHLLSLMVNRQGKRASSPA